MSQGGEDANKGHVSERAPMGGQPGLSPMGTHRERVWNKPQDQATEGQGSWGIYLPTLATPCLRGIHSPGPAASPESTSEHLLGQRAYSCREIQKEGGFEQNACRCLSGWVSGGDPGNVSGWDSICCRPICVIKKF